MELVDLFASDHNKDNKLPVISEGSGIEELYGEWRRLFSQYEGTLNKFNADSEKFRENAGLVEQVARKFQQNAPVDSRHKEAIQSGDSLVLYNETKKNVPAIFYQSPEQIRTEAENKINQVREESLTPLERRLREIPPLILSRVEEALMSQPIQLKMYVHNYEEGQGFGILLPDNLTPVQEVCLMYAFTGKIPTGLAFMAWRDSELDWEAFGPIEYDQVFAKVMGKKSYPKVTLSSGHDEGSYVFLVKPSEINRIDIEGSVKSINNTYLYPREQQYLENITNGIDRLGDKSEKLLAVRRHLPVKTLGKNMALTLLSEEKISIREEELSSHLGEKVKQHYRVAVIDPAIAISLSDKANRKVSGSYDLPPNIYAINTKLSREYAAEFLSYLLLKQQEGFITLTKLS